MKNVKGWVQEMTALMERPAPGLASLLVFALLLGPAGCDQTLCRCPTMTVNIAGPADADQKIWGCEDDEVCVPPGLCEETTD